MLDFHPLPYEIVQGAPALNSPFFAEAAPCASGIGERNVLDCGLQTREINSSRTRNNLRSSRESDPTQRRRPCSRACHGGLSQRRRNSVASRSRSRRQIAHIGAALEPPAPPARNGGDRINGETREHEKIRMASYSIANRIETAIQATCEASRVRSNRFDSVLASFAHSRRLWYRRRLPKLRTC
jgi:hypothetical protein